jgi:glucose-1-phosphate cytidylyltransferase
MTKAVILAGGLGTRLSEETVTKPKPMIEIGGKPILWHIMKIYSHYGVNDFIVCLGYRGGLIKEYFANYFLHSSDITFDVKNNKMEVHNDNAEPWRVTLVDTGDATQTGGRLKRVKKYLDNEPFCFTYGDGVSDIPVDRVLALHKKEKRLATVTAVQPPGRFGALSISGTTAASFHEKPAGDGTWINGGYFVLEPAVLDFIEGDKTPWEGDPLVNIIAQQKLTVFQHTGFWQSMDTLREKNLLESLWQSGKAPWKVWK